MSCAASSQAQTSPTSPCAACKVQRKKCSEECILAPYFPRDHTQKFLLLRKVFGNGHVIRFLKDLPADKRDDAINSMVYEASERVRDPVHGCVGVINDLQIKVSELQSQLASTQEEVARITEQNANLLTIITGHHEVSYPNFYIPSLQDSEDTHTNPPVLNDIDTDLQLWEPLWT